MGLVGRYFVVVADYDEEVIFKNEREAKKATPDYGHTVLLYVRSMYLLYIPPLLSHTSSTTTHPPTKQGTPRECRKTTISFLLIFYCS